jgi:ComF family protein
MDPASVALSPRAASLSASLCALARDLVGDLLAPRGCAACDGQLSRKALFCATCAASVEPAPPTRLAGLPVVAGALYGGAVVQAVRKLKFSDRPDLAAPLAALAVRALSEARVAREQADLVVPVPAHRSRLGQRGYNQAALLAREVAAWWGMRCAPAALLRVHSGDAQVGKGAHERRSLPEGTFAPTQELAGVRVALVDDVVTTGATAAACASALRRAGATVALVVAPARAVAPDDAARWP